MRDVGAAGAAYVEEYGLPLIDAVRSGDPKASSIETTEAGKRRVDELRTLLTAFIDAERETYTARQETAVDLAGASTNIATIALAASVILIVVFIAYLARTIVRTGDQRCPYGRLSRGRRSHRPDAGDRSSRDRDARAVVQQPGDLAR